MAAFSAAWLCCPHSAICQEPLHVFKHPAWVGAVDFGSASSALLTASADGSVRLWLLNSNEERVMVKGTEKTDGPIAFCLVEGIVAVGKCDGSVLLDQSPKWEGKLQGHRGAIMSLSYDPWHAKLACGSVDGTITLWHPLNKIQLATLKGHKSWVNSVVVMDGGEFLVSGSSDGTVKIWDAAEHKLVRTLDVTPTEIRSVACSNIDKVIAAGLRYGDVQLWDSKEAKRLKTFKAHEGDCWAVKFSADGETLITAGGDWGKPGEVKLWNVKTRELKATFKHTGEVLCVAVSADGTRLAAGGGDKNVIVWDTSKLLAPAKLPQED